MSTTRQPIAGSSRSRCRYRTPGSHSSPARWRRTPAVASATRSRPHSFPLSASSTSANDSSPSARETSAAAKPPAERPPTTSTIARSRGNGFALRTSPFRSPRPTTRSAAGRIFASGESSRPSPVKTPAANGVVSSRSPLAASVVKTGTLSSARREPHARRAASAPAMTAGRSERASRAPSSDHAPGAGGSGVIRSWSAPASSSNRSRWTGPGISAFAIPASVATVRRGSPSVAYAFVKARPAASWSRRLCIREAATAGPNASATLSTGSSS